MYRRTVAFRGSKSRNKVSVGEPAEGSLSVMVVFAVRRQRVPSIDRFGLVPDAHRVRTLTPFTVEIYQV